MKIPWLRLTGIFVIAWIVHTLDLQKFLASFTSIETTYLLVSFFFLLSFIFFKCLRWYSFLRIQKIEFSLFQSMNAYIIAQFFALVTPGKMGDFIKIFYLEKDANVNHFRATSSVFADRICDMGILVLVAFCGIYAGIMPSEYELISQIFGGLLVASMLPLAYRPYMVSVFKTITKLPGIGKQLLRRSLLFKEIYTSFEEFKTRLVLMPLLITGIAYGALFLHAYFLAKGLSISASFVQIAFIIVIGNIASLIPISIGGIGPREAAVQSLFVNLLNTHETLTASHTAQLEAQGLAFSLSYYGIFLLTVGVIGGIAWLRNPISIESVRRLVVELRK